MSRRKRLILILAVLGGATAFAGVWQYWRGHLTAEGKQYVGTWAHSYGGVWEIRADRTLIRRWTDPSTGEPMTGVDRWRVRSGWLYVSPPGEGLLSRDVVAAVSGTYEVVAREEDRFSIRDVSDASRCRATSF
jgi:hypothetical protein